MKTMLPLVLIASLGTAGCCTRLEPDEFARLTGTDRETGALCGIFSGWGTLDEPERFQAVYTPVTPAEIGERLCRGVDLEDYASCINQTVEYYREASREPLPRGASTAAPFAMSLNGRLYLGTYDSDPFRAYFHVADEGSSTCRGSYNALAGDTEAVFDVRCDDGRRGTADIVLDREGRNGIGGVVMDDGTRGDIVFGRGAVRIVLPPPVPG
jgi:hypothetical protein